MSYYFVHKMALNLLYKITDMINILCLLLHWLEREVSDMDQFYVNLYFTTELCPTSWHIK